MPEGDHIFRAARSLNKVLAGHVVTKFDTAYAHLSRVRVHSGQHVRRGQRLGLAGCTGSCSGTHLHFEIERRGVPVDPLRFLG